ncbi:prenyltransferase/squalene oxidase repeat-containing protein [Streptomyces sp. NPDC001508]|uniref:prenyltransferase/squalene oxidase repeat-containing protein n=1 Tax=Streptomyces sp. NPDC001508 TaxID=3154656 RepID=UPI0033199902
MNVRRSAAALATAGVLAAAAPALAASPSPSPSAVLPSGLYGDSDPKYDGVWRQSLALLAQRTVSVTPAAKAVDWLTGQQCASGAFAAFRAEPAGACDAKVMTDTNSTAAAVQALVAVGGHEDATGKAVTWLKSVQNKDGGWGYAPGGASDANSTAVVIGALAAAGERPAEVAKGGRSPYDALLKLALPCTRAGTGDGAGAFAYQPDKKGALAANADATAAAVVGVLGAGLDAKAGKPDQTSGTESGKESGTESGKESGTGCVDSDRLTPERAAANGASYLARAVAEDGHLTSALAGAPEQPDYGNTADAVVALAAQGGAQRAAKPLAWLEKNAVAWAKQSGPAGYAQLIFAAHAAGADPRDFGGTDLVRALNATGPAPQTDEATKATKTADASGEKKDDGGSGAGLWWMVGAGLAAGAGIGFLLSGRRKQQQL